MTRPGLAAAAFLSALFLAAPVASWAQPTGRLSGNSNNDTVSGQAASASRTGSGKSAAASADAAKISPADKARGLKEAPALVAASDVKTCEVADAAFRGTATQKGADGKAVKSNAYEVACRSGPGYLVLAAEGQPKPQMINCIIAAGGNGIKCVLPPDTDAKAELASYVVQSGRTCDVSGERYVGSTSSGLTYYEIGCSNGPGFLMSVSDAQAGTPQVIDCLSVQDTNKACQLTTKAQIVAGYAPLVARSGKACQVSDVRPIGASKETGDVYTELACGAAPGFVLIQDKGGAYKSTLDCGKAEAAGIGCKMTDATVAQTADSAAYAKLAAKAGFPCQVSKYRYIGQDSTNREVVELACSDRPDGAVAALSDTGKSDIYDCVRAGALGGQSCKLTQASVVYPKYTDALVARGKSTCKVSGASYLGSTSSGLDYVETACADGAPGWVIGFKSGTNTAADVLTCKQATGAGMACKLPTNTASAKG